MPCSRAVRQQITHLRDNYQPVVPRMFFYGDDSMNNEARPVLNEEEATALAMRVSVVSIIVNLALSLIKLLAGFLAKSGAMISDAVHSASDVFSTFIVMIGVSISEKKPDKEHPYGHERLESVAAVLLAVILAATGFGIGFPEIRIN